MIEHIPAIEAQIEENNLIEKYKSDGWIMLNKVKGGSLGGSSIKWNIPLIIMESKKYRKISDFSKKSKGAYSASKRFNILNDIREYYIKINTP